jgi:4-hydroxy-3-methylbut-2-en-1-yl diphosphate reductase
MKVNRASAMGLCFGVRDALEAAQNIEQPTAVTINGELVHNQQVLVQLQERGFQTLAEDEPRRVPQTSTVLVTAHGISERERRRLLAAGMQLSGRARIERKPRIAAARP